MAAAPEPVHEMPEAAVSGLRSGGGGAGAETRRSRDAREIALALPGSVAVAAKRRARFVRGRGHAVTAREKVWSGDGPGELVGERRSAKPDAKFQGARNGDSGVDGETSW